MSIHRHRNQSCKRAKHTHNIKTLPYSGCNHQAVTRQKKNYTNTGRERQQFHNRTLAVYTNRKNPSTRGRAQETGSSAGKMNSTKENPNLHLHRRPLGEKEQLGQGQSLRTRELTGLQIGT
ncbi:hypothetical protein Bca101_087223 [Brassica carinata]